VSTAVGQLIAGTRAAYGLPQPSFARRRIQALLIGLGVVLALPFLAYALADASSSRVVVIVLAIVIAVAAIAGTYIAAVGRRLSVRAHLPGLGGATIAIVGITLAFTSLVRRSGTYEAIYGAVAGSVITMIAVWLMVYAVLLGALLNTLLSEARTSAE
jgi:membrane protein